MAEVTGSASYDVFLCHSSKDKPQVRELARVLREESLRVFLDEDNLVPGQPWMEGLEAAIQKSRAALILYGPSGLRPWTTREMRAFLDEFVQRGAAVIPVLMPGAPDSPELPIFLRQFHWVDLREGSSGGLKRLLAGIRAAPSSSTSTPPRESSQAVSAMAIPVDTGIVPPANTLSCLYYPFSRCVEPASLKQLLLVFDHVTFLDPVTDDQWRAHLLNREWIIQGGVFKGHRELHKSLDSLKREGAIRVVDPTAITAIVGETTAASALSDLMDPVWSNLASAPSKYGLPARRAADGRATWQIFAPKLPHRFVDALRQEALHSHLLTEGGDNLAWTLSYEAGSAAALNAHIAAAEALSLAPVTDSTLHHTLYLRKLARRRSTDNSPFLSDALQTGLAIKLVGELLPKRVLEKLTFEQIIDFRGETRGARQALIDALGRKLIVESSGNTGDAGRVSARILDSLATDVRDYVGKMGEIKTRLFSSLIPTLSKSMVPWGLFAVGLTYAGVGAGQVLAGSIAAAALATLKSTLRLKAERDRLAKSTSPAVAYLSRVFDLAS